MAVQRRIIGFHQDEEGHWVADLECGHTQHVRHDPPWQVREWVTTPEGRDRFLGSELFCRICEDDASQPSAEDTQQNPEGRTRPRLPSRGTRSSESAMVQPVARYTEADLERVLARDFPAEEHDAIRAALRGDETGSGRDESLRVAMACLKCAAGDAAKVSEFVKAARQDYRDVLAWAEYPRYMLAGDEEECQRAIEEDWAELQAWLHRP